MILETQLTADKIRIIASYKKEENNPIFLSILQAAKEIEKPFGAADMQSHLSGPALSNREWENILSRLTDQHYFSHNEDWQAYELTDLAREAINRKTYLQSLKGELIIYRLREKQAGFPHSIIQIEESPKKWNNKKKEEGEKRKSADFELEQNQFLELKDGKYVLESVEETCEWLGEEEVRLKLEVNKKAIMSLGALSFEWQTERGEAISEELLRQEFLSDQYGNDYLSDKQLVLTSFDLEDIRFERSVFINEPRIRGIRFDKTELKGVHFNAETTANAEAWRQAIFCLELTDYIFTDSELAKLDEKIRAYFLALYTLPSLDRQAWITRLSKDKKSHFYPLQKLTAPLLLTY